MAKRVRGDTLTSVLPFAFDKDEYNRLCAKAQILVIQMVGDNLSVSAEYFDHQGEVKLKLDNHMLGAWMDDDKETVTAIFRYEVKVKHQRKDLVVLRSDFLVAYSVPEQIDKENAEAYCQRQGLFAAYPYFRSHFSHVNGLANLSLPLLPVLNSGPVRVARKSAVIESTEVK